MLHKSFQTGMLPNLSNAALLGILWVTRFFTPLESPAIYGGDVERKYSFIIEGGVKAPTR
jgi:hypothetical protein